MNPAQMNMMQQSGNPYLMPYYPTNRRGQLPEDFNEILTTNQSFQDYATEKAKKDLEAILGPINQQSRQPYQAQAPVLSGPTPGFYGYGPGQRGNVNRALQQSIAQGQANIPGIGMMSSPNRMTYNFEDQ